MESSSTCVTGKLAGTETRMNHCLADRYWITNRPFYRYGGHIELTGFKEYYGHRRTGNFLPGGAVIHLPKKFLQVAQIFTKQSKGN